MLENVRSIQSSENIRQIDEVQKRLAAINEKIRQQQKIQVESTTLSPAASSENSRMVFDWTRDYQKWEGWNDLDDLKAKKDETESQIEQLYSQKDVLGHTHDHSKEREFFLLPETEKIKRCEQFKQLGNYLFTEGMFERAAIQYQTVMGFYEYIFPEDIEIQNELDELRMKCICNLSLCMIRIREYRKAVELCTSIINSSSSSSIPKAYFRRGVAYKLLDEYESSLKDFEECKRLGVEDAAIDQEISELQKLIRGYETTSQAFAKGILSSNDTKSDVEEIDMLSDIESKGFAFLNNWHPLEPVFSEQLESILDLRKWIE